MKIKKLLPKEMGSKKSEALALINEASPSSIMILADLFEDLRAPGKNISMIRNIASILEAINVLKVLFEKRILEILMQITAGPILTATSTGFQTYPATRPHLSLQGTTQSQRPADLSERPAPTEDMQSIAVKHPNRFVFESEFGDKKVITEMNLQLSSNFRSYFFLRRDETTCEISSPIFINRIQDYVTVKKGPGYSKDIFYETLDDSSNRLEFAADIVLHVKDAAAAFFSNLKTDELLRSRISKRSDDKK